jgi:hypothetical protein
MFGNQDIVGMVSTEDELVNFSTTIHPQDAKGMVEKWLLQVSQLMLSTPRMPRAWSRSGYSRLVSSCYPPPGCQGHGREVVTPG